MANLRSGYGWSKEREWGRREEGRGKSNREGQREERETNRG